MKIVLDTNIHVAAGFNKHSHSASILEGVRRGEYDLVWDKPTYREIQTVIEKIPPLKWNLFDDLFLEANQVEHHTDPHLFDVIDDSSDRKFAALAYAVKASLITNDVHFLSVRSQLPIMVQTPAEFLYRES